MSLMSAGLGMGWLAYESERRKLDGGASALVTGGTLHYPVEDFMAAIWLGPVARGTSMSFRPVEWFGKQTSSRLREYTPMYFIYGKQDTASAGVVPGYLSAIKKVPEHWAPIS